MSYSNTTPKKFKPFENAFEKETRIKKVKTEYQKPKHKKLLWLID